MPLTEEEKKERHREANKRWREKNREKLREKSRIYSKEYYEKNKEKSRIYSKEYREKNKEKIREQRRKYYEENIEKEREQSRKYYEENIEKEREKINERNRKWREENSQFYKKTHLISNWKRKGVIHDDFDTLYNKYLNCENCEECGVEFGKKGDSTGTFKCLDHCHITGAFRNFLCCACNLKRR